MLEDKNKLIGDLETKNQELTERLKESNDNTDAKFEIVKCV